MNPRHVVVIGGGIAGVAAAARLRELGGPRLRITIVEQAPRLGGKIHTGQLAGVPVETGAETFLVRRPEALALAESVGLADQLVHPSGLPAALVIDNELRDLPRRTVMGVPARASDVADVLSPSGRERLRRATDDATSNDPLLGEQDVTVGALVRKHFGGEIVDRLVDPLLGGVYSGRADDLSLAVTLPQLAAAARRHGTLAEAVASCLPPNGAAGKAGDKDGESATAHAASPTPAASGGNAAGPDEASDAAGNVGGAADVVSPAESSSPAASGRGGATVGGSDAVSGLGRATTVAAFDNAAVGQAAASSPPGSGAAVFGTAAAGATAQGAATPVFGSVEGGLSRLVEAAAAASGAQIVLGKPVRELLRTPQGWRVVAGDTRSPRLIDADAVVLAVPARPAARLLRDVDEPAAAEIGVLDYASIALASFAFEGVELPSRSGFLVPAGKGRTIKAATFFSRKWPHLARPGLGLVRVSMGRYGEEQVLQREDAELIAIARRELSQVLGMALPEPVEAKLDRWGGGLPQYRPGHLDRVRRARTALAGHPIALAGALADGVGIPACVASGRAAAETVMAFSASARS